MPKLSVPTPSDLMRMLDNAGVEGVLRSSFLPLEQRHGTRLFLSYENGWYRVHTRFENFFQRRTLQPAADYYERVLLGTQELP